MQQQPPRGGRPTPPGAPYQPPAGGTQPGAAPPPAGGPLPYGSAPGGYPPYSAPYPAAPGAGRKKRRSLRFLAGTCVFSAWLTLILSVIGAISMFGAGLAAARAAAAAASGTQYFPPVSSTPSSPDSPGVPPGGEPDDLGLPANPLSSLPKPSDFLLPIQKYAPQICYGSGAFTLVTGLVCFLLLLGLGQMCYVLLDLEEQSAQTSQALQVVIARLGAGR
jgi:hypothetical protein